MIETQPGIVPTFNPDGSRYWHDPPLQIVADELGLDVTCYVYERNEMRHIQIKSGDDVCWQVGSRAEALAALQMEAASKDIERECYGEI